MFDVRLQVLVTAIGELEHVGVAAGADRFIDGTQGGDRVSIRLPVVGDVRGVFLGFRAG
jgi:hypothetical protein